MEGLVSVVKPNRDTCALRGEGPHSDKANEAGVFVSLSVCVYVCVCTVRARYSFIRH